MTDVIVIGGGPAGSTAAALLAQRGHSVVLLEKERFPRFQIGESLLPYNNDLFERLGVLAEVEAKGSYPKYGAEFITGDGLLTYTFRFARNLAPKYSRSFQVRRAEFDELLLRNAAKEGVDVREGVSVRDIDLSDPSRVGIAAIDQSGASVQLEARFVVDASGHSSVVGAKVGGKRDEPTLRKIAIFAHYRNVEPSAPDDNAGNTVIAILRNAWFWLIPVSSEITSIGLVVDRDIYLSSGLAAEELLSRTIAETPYVAKRMEAAERVTPVMARKDFSFWMERVYGPNFALVGDAAGFFDPIFSTGVFMAMKTADIASAGIDEYLRTGRHRLLGRYQRSLRAALKRYFSFISSFYRREFLEVFLQPQERFGLLPVIVGILAGDVFERKRMRWRLPLFFALTRLQGRRGVIAPRIAWDTLPAAASAGRPVPAEERVV